MLTLQLTRCFTGAPAFRTHCAHGLSAARQQNRCSSFGEPRISFGRSYRSSRTAVNTLGSFPFRFCLERSCILLRRLLILYAGLPLVKILPALRSP